MQFEQLKNLSSPSELKNLGFIQSLVDLLAIPTTDGEICYVSALGEMQTYVWNRTEWMKVGLNYGPFTRGVDGENF